MKDYFLTCYYNYCGYESRYRLTKEFMDRYPYFHLVEVAYGEKPFLFSGTNIVHKRKINAGFINNELINQFIVDHFEDMRSLTFVDSDCVLPDDFMYQISHFYDEYSSFIPIYLQPYKTTKMIYKSDKRVGRQYNGVVYNVMSCTGGTDHTGLCYSYNRSLLQKLLPQLLPTCLILGGFDTVLYYALFRDKLSFDCLLEIIKSEKINDELKSFYNLISVINPCVEYLNLNITTYEHGLQRDRRYNERWYWYKNLSNKVIEHYFKQRKEDNYLE